MKLANVVRLSAIAVSLLITLHALPNPVVVPNWTVSEFQPNLSQGGRTNSVAVNPSNASEMYAASDTGGLFKSINGGVTWTHVNNLKVNFTQAVVYAQANPPIVLVTARADFKTINGGGVWRSEDGGSTWTHPLQGPQLSGYEISSAGANVVVGTTDGMYASVNNQGTIWRFLSPAPFPGSVVSVLITPGQGGQLPRVYAAGPGGVRTGSLAIDGNNVPAVSDWTNPGNFIGGDTITMHSFGRSALSPDHAFLTNGHQLFRTSDRGLHWTEVTLPMHGNPACAGTPFIKTTLRSKNAALFLDMYHGNACGVDRLSQSVFGPLDYTGTWQPLTVGHFTRDLALYQADPVLLASNGGLHSTADRGATWTYTGGGSGGYNALQVTGITGQFVGKDKFIDLYFATQDNNIWWWNTENNTLGYETEMTEGFYIEAERRVKFAADSKITYAGCHGGCSSRFANRYLLNPGTVPQSLGLGVPVLINKGVRIHRTSSGLDVTSDPNLMAWQPFASFTAMTAVLPKSGFAGTDGSTIVYQPFEQGLTRAMLRIEHDAAGNVTIANPGLSNFGTLALSRSMSLALQPVYDVARDTGRRLIGVDEKQIALSTMSGTTWSEIQNVKNLVTNGGALQFRASLLDYQAPVPLVTAISFFPYDASQVLMGTSEGGIYYSNDSGLTWAAITGSDGATSITSFFWASLNTVYVSSFGRGLWRLDNHSTALSEAFDQFCATCAVIAQDGSRPAFDQSALVFDGEILGVRTEKGQLRQIFVTPGSSVVFTGDPKDPQTSIAVTESEGKDSFEPLPKPPADGWIATGVVFTRDTTLTGTAFNATELAFVPPASGAKSK